MSELEVELELLRSTLEEKGVGLRDIIKEEKQRKEAELQVKKTHLHFFFSFIFYFYIFLNFCFCFTLSEFLLFYTFTFWYLQNILKEHYSLKLLSFLPHILFKQSFLFKKEYLLQCFPFTF